MTSLAREVILGRVRAAVQNESRAPMEPLPASMRFPARVAGDREIEIEMFLGEIVKLGGNARRIRTHDEFRVALAELVRAEKIERATTWDVKNVRDELSRLGIRLIEPLAPHRELASCDLGVTGADAALPDMGTIVLRTTPTQSQFVSLLPRVHLALVRPENFHADLHSAFELVKHDQHTIFITGPSRTADIEKVLTIGVHGPKSLHVWCCEM